VRSPGTSIPGSFVRHSRAGGNPVRCVQAKRNARTENTGVAEQWKLLAFWGRTADEHPSAIIRVPVNWSPKGKTRPMQFHDYRTLKQQLLADQDEYPSKAAHYRWLRKLKPGDLRRKLLETKFESLNEHDQSTARAALAEDVWVDEQRPYYCVWPIAVELCRTVELSCELSKLEMQNVVLLLRFARGHEPLGVSVAMLSWYDDFVDLPSTIHQATPRPCRRGSGCHRGR